jgi:murein DD-endopeptidase MepM/ murein hydrolase activator NlpD
MLKRFLCCLLCLAPALGTAKHMYQYTDAQGIVHYTDVNPGEGVPDVKSTVVRTDRQPLIRLREDGPDGDRTLTFVNSAGGPVSMDVAFEVQSNIQSDPILPARIVLPGSSETHALHVFVVDSHAGFSYRLKYSYMPGDFRAQHDAAATYRAPFAPGSTFGIAQAFGGLASHTDAQNYYAIDIVMPEGTPVLAARDGVVMTLDNDFYGAGLDMARYGDRANNIRVVHADGSMAVYAHLKLESSRVHVGQHVQAGQVLALSGDTGYTTGPHLHFCVQVNQQMKLVSVPFKILGPDGAFTPTQGMLLTAP